MLMDASSTSTGTVRSPRGLWYAALLLALIGLGFAVELTRIHLKLQSDPSHRSFCNISATVNCDSVAASSYSILIGLPLSVWGIFGYTAALVASLWGLRTNHRAAAGLLWFIGATCVAGALVLAAISAWVLHTFCLFCVGTWLVDVGLFVVATRLKQATFTPSILTDLYDWLRGNVVTALLLLAIGVTSLGFAYRNFGHNLGRGQTAMAASLPQVVSGRPSEGVDPSGQHYVGAKSPKLTITEFSDYQCPHCALAHHQLGALVLKYPAAIRVVHRHFPLDNDCNPKIKHVFHTHACYYARLAICAAEANKFWPGHDYLFAHGSDEVPVAIESFARAIDVPVSAIKDCLANRADGVLKRDVELGLGRELDGTPTFIVDGEKFDGELPADVLRDYPL